MASTSRRDPPCCLTCRRPAKEGDLITCNHCGVFHFCNQACLDKSWDTHAPVCESIQRKWKRAKDVALPAEAKKANLRVVCFACGKTPASPADIGRCAGCRAVPFCKSAACQV